MVYHGLPGQVGSDSSLVSRSSSDSIWLSSVDGFGDPIGGNSLDSSDEALELPNSISLKHFKPVNLNEPGVSYTPGELLTLLSSCSVRWQGQEHPFFWRPIAPFVAMPQMLLVGSCSYDVEWFQSR